MRASESGFESDQRQVAHLARDEIPAAQRAVLHHSASASALTVDRCFRAAHFQPDVDGGGAIGFHTEPLSRGRLEAGLGDLEFIVAEVHGVEPVDAGFVVLVGPPHSRSRCASARHCAGNDGTGCIRHCAGHCPRLVWPRTELLKRMSVADSSFIA